MKPYYIRVYPDSRHTKVIIIPIFEDNYVYLLTDDSKKAFIVDPGESDPVCNVISELGLDPTYLLITHAHGDHVGGVEAIQKKYPNVQQIDYSNCIQDEQELMLKGRLFKVFKTPGHKADHICFFENDLKILFCGDLLFRFGCGRILDGTFAELYQSLQKIKSLPVDADVYCTHEYTRQNLAFCVEKGLLNPSYFSKEELQLIEATPSLPVKLEIEFKYNPFLRAISLEQLTDFRRMRNEFSAKVIGNK